MKKTYLNKVGRAIVLTAEYKRGETEESEKAALLEAKEKLLSQMADKLNPKKFYLFEFEHSEQPPFNKSIGLIATEVKICTEELGTKRDLLSTYDDETFAREIYKYFMSCVRVPRKTAEEFASWLSSKLSK